METPGGDWGAFAETFETYVEEIRQQLNAEAAGTFTPDLSLLDAMIESLLIE